MTSGSGEQVDQCNDEDGDGNEPRDAEVAQPLVRVLLPRELGGRLEVRQMASASCLSRMPEVYGLPRRQPLRCDAPIALNRIVRARVR